MTPSPFQLVVALVAVGFVLLGLARFIRFCLGELAGTPDSRLLVLDRQRWLVLIVLFIPLGGVLFLLYGRPR